jgi:hypothetical protein
MSGIWMPGQPRPISDANKQKTEVENSNVLIEKKKNSPLRATKLSGTTMNMRFMQRNAESKSERYLNGVILHAKTPIDDSNDDSETQQRHDAQHNHPDSLACATATPCDMYGAQANILGRRSFGGFNPPMARAWQEDRLAIKNLGKVGVASDKELLQKYKHFVDSGKRRTDEPIGKLDDKLKRKRRKAQSLS